MKARESFVFVYRDIAAEKSLYYYGHHEKNDAKICSEVNPDEVVALVPAPWAPLYLCLRDPSILIFAGDGFIRKRKKRTQYQFEYVCECNDQREEDDKFCPVIEGKDFFDK